MSSVSDVEVVSQNARPKSRLLFFLLPLIFGFLGLLAGAGWGFYQFFVATGEGAECSASIEISGGNGHGVRIRSMRLIQGCLKSNGLENLQSFERLSEDEIALTVQKNLKVEETGTDPTFLNLRYRSILPDDAQIVLNNLIRSYEDLLEQDFKNRAAKKQALLRSHNEVLGDQVNEMLQKRSKLISEYGFGSHEGFMNDIAARITDAKDRIANRSALKKRVGDAIGTDDKNDQEALDEMLWMLMQSGELVSGEKRSEEQKDDELTAKSKLQRFNKMLDSEIDELRSMVERKTQEYERHHEEAKRKFAIMQMVDQVDTKLAQVQASLFENERELFEYEDIGAKARDDGNSLQILQPAERGVTVASLSPLAISMLGGLGLVVGVLFGLVVAIIFR